jgi:hypothetical protein
MGGLAAPDRQHHLLSLLAAEVIVGGWLFLLDLSARRRGPKQGGERENLGSSLGRNFERNSSATLGE